MSDIDNENAGSGDNTGGGGAAHVSAKVRMGALQTTIRNIRQKPSSIFGRATGMTMQEFIDNGYAEEGKAYDSQGNEIENWDTYWNYNIGYPVLQDKTITELPTKIPVIINKQIVTNFTSLFSGCSSLVSLDLTNLDTSNITNFFNLFSSCSALTSIVGIENLDVSNVTNMHQIFSNCKKLTSLDLSKWNTSKCTNMYAMFMSCQGMTELNLSNFDTTNVTNMGNMFNNCSKLTSLDLSSFNTRNVTNMYSMFANSTNLKTIYVSNENWVISQANRDYMFQSCGTSSVTRI